MQDCKETAGLLQDRIYLIPKHVCNHIAVGQKKFREIESKLKTVAKMQPDCVKKGCCKTYTRLQQV